MRKAIAIATGFLIVAGFTVAAQEKAKEEPKAQSGHDTMAKKGGGSADSGKIARAMSAAPPSVSRNATIMEMTADGNMKQLRAGTNGWMCMIAADGTPMCLDKEWQSGTSRPLTPFVYLDFTQEFGVGSHRIGHRGDL